MSNTVNQLIYRIFWIKVCYTCVNYSNIMSASSTAELDQTISALQGGLISVPPATALSVIDSFERQVQDLGKNEIAIHLSALKQLLRSGNATSPDIGKVLTQLGEQTTLAASSADTNVSSKLQQLGQLLTQAGNSLHGATPKSGEISQVPLASDI
jgi:ABC-type transporter Mla subunit MlaD